MGCTLLDEDEDGYDDAVAVTKMLWDHFDVSNNKLSRPEQLQQKEDAFLDIKTRDIKEFTMCTGKSSDGQD